MHLTEGPRWPFLDLVRFGAALLVLFGHARGLFFDSITKVPDAGLAVRAFYLATSLQHEGVILFFVVSGFLVGGSAWRALAAGRFDPLRYLVNRFSRIYLVLIPSLVLVLMLDRLGAALLADTRLYAERPLLPSGVDSGWTWTQVPCHLAALQGPFCTAWGANPPLWSLGWEWLFYLVAPVLFAMLLAPLGRAVRGLALACLGLSLVTLLGFPGEWLFWFSAWLIGTIASAMAPSRRVALPAGLAGLAFCTAALVVSRTGLVPLGLTDLAVALGLGLGLASADIAEADILSAVARRGAAFSYSLYLIHLPVALFAGAWLQRLGWPATLSPPGLRTFAAFAIAVAVALLAASLFAQLTERHTASLRNLLLRR